MKYIDANGQILGRMASYAAKQALMGEDVIIVNAEKAVISGEKHSVFKAEKAKLEIKNIGNYRKGPYHQKRPDRYVRRTIRGMLPFKNLRGREAYKRVNVYMGLPNELKEKHNLDISKAKPEKISGIQKQLRRSVTIEEVCRHIGGGI